MAELWCEFEGPDGRVALPPDALEFTPRWYAATAVGGPERAEVQVDGPPEALHQILRWVGYKAVIRNRHGSPVWWGYVEEASVALGALVLGRSLRDMANRVTVTYADRRAGGGQEQAETAWAEDGESVARFGAKELRWSLGDGNQEQAEATRASILRAKGQPLPSVEVTTAGQGSHASLRCAGYWQLLGWAYYAQPSGLEEHNVDGGRRQPLGLGFSSNLVGFDSIDDGIHEVNGQLKHFEAGQRIRVSGAVQGGNNGVWTLKAANGKDAFNYTAATISFEATDDIRDSALGFEALDAGDMIQVSGATANNGWHLLDGATPDAVETETTFGGVITTAAAGPSVTIKRGNSVLVQGALVKELPGASVTVHAAGVKVAQSFSLGLNLTWTVDRIELKARQIGASGDLVRVELCADSSGSPGAVLASALVAASEFGDSFGWVGWDMGNTVSLAFGTTYWIVVSRTGTPQALDFYELDSDEEAAYSRGVLKLWDGSAWYEPAGAEAADLLFRVMGAWDTTRQVSEMAALQPLLSGTDVVDISGVETHQWRDGERTMMDEAEELLESGSAAGRRMLAQVSPERVVRVWEQPDPEAAAGLLIRTDGTLLDGNGEPLESGVLPAGEWCRLAELPPSIGQLTGLDRFFVERAEYSAEDGVLTLDPEGARDRWELGALRQG